MLHVLSTADMRERYCLVRREMPLEVQELLGSVPEGYTRDVTSNTYGGGCFL